MIAVKRVSEKPWIPGTHSATKSVRSSQLPADAQPLSMAAAVAKAIGQAKDFPAALASFKRACQVGDVALIKSAVTKAFALAPDLDTAAQVCQAANQLDSDAGRYYSNLAFLDAVAALDSLVVRPAPNANDPCWNTWKNLPTGEPDFSTSPAGFDFAERFEGAIRDRLKQGGAVTTSLNLLGLVRQYEGGDWNEVPYFLENAVKAAKTPEEVKLVKAFTESTGRYQGAIQEKEMAFLGTYDAAIAAADQEDQAIKDLRAQQLKANEDRLQFTFDLRAAVVRDHMNCQIAALERALQLAPPGARRPVCKRLNYLARNRDEALRVAQEAQSYGASDAVKAARTKAKLFDDRDTPYRVIWAWTPVGSIDPYNELDFDHTGPSDRATLLRW